MLIISGEGVQTLFWVQKLKMKGIVKMRRQLKSMRVCLQDHRLSVFVRELRSMLLNQYRQLVD